MSIPEVIQAMPDTLKRYQIGQDTEVKLNYFHKELFIWSKKHNFISSNDRNKIWPRHIDDSLQLLWFLNNKTKLWLDIGTGAGFPGLIMAIAAKDIGYNCDFILIESNHKKCSFLNYLCRNLNLEVDIINRRAEEVLPSLPLVDFVSARAFDSLTHTLAVVSPLLASGAIGIFPKGRKVYGEIIEASKSWQFNHRIFTNKAKATRKTVAVWRN